MLPLLAHKTSALTMGGVHKTTFSYSYVIGVLALGQGTLTEVEDSVSTFDLPILELTSLDQLLFIMPALYIF